MRKVALISVISFFGTLLVITGFSRSADAQVNGCYNSQDGTFRILIESSQCKKNETPISLYAKGDVDALVSGEAAIRQAADTTETTARQADDETLQSNLAAEVSARQSGDTALQTNLNAEANVRLSADTNLQARVTTLETQLSSYQEVKDLLCDYAISNALPGCPSFCTCPKSVFVSSATYQGDLGGLEEADSKCQALAEAAHLPGSFKAWLSVTGGASPANRFSHPTNYSYVLADRRTVIAASWNDLTNDSLQHEINMDENGRSGINDWVWTNTDESGGPSTLVGDCSDWTSNSPDDWGVVGSSNGYNWWTGWSDMYRSRGCNQYRRLYCFQQ